MCLDGVLGVTFNGYAGTVLQASQMLYGSHYHNDRERG